MFFVLVVLMRFFEMCVMSCWFISVIVIVLMVKCMW